MNNPSPRQSVSLFFVFSPEDMLLWNELDRHLAPLRREKLVADFHRAAVQPGQNEDQELLLRIAEARLIVLLVSSDFLASSSCIAQMRMALQRKERREAQVIVVQLRPCALDTSELCGFPVLPVNGPVTGWGDREEAWSHLVREIRRQCLTIVMVTEPSDVAKGTSLLTDNWTLQTVAFLLKKGFSPKDTRYLEPESESGKHSRTVSAAGVQVQALLSLLVDIILRERIVVEKDWAHTWERLDGFEGLCKAGIVDQVDFRGTFPSLPEITKRMIPRVCTTEWMRRTQLRNEQEWQLNGRPARPFESLAMWGTAGQLARAHLLNLTYSSHPIRRHILARGRFKRPDANFVLTEWIRTERLRLFEKAFPSGELRGLNLSLSPIAIEVIEACAHREELIPTAIQFRERYAQLRQWIGGFQNAIADAEPRALGHYRAELESAAAMVRPVEGASRFGSTAMSLRIDSANAAQPDMRPQVVSTLMSDLLQSKAGETSLRKLLRLFEEEHSAVGLRALEHLGDEQNRADSGG